MKFLKGVKWLFILLTIYVVLYFFGDFSLFGTNIKEFLHQNVTCAFLNSIEEKAGLIGKEVHKHRENPLDKLE